MKKVYIYLTAGGCPRRRVETANLANIFRENGYLPTRSLKEADLIVVNTCSYNNIRDVVSLQIIKEFRGYNKKMVVTGCLPAINPEGMKKVFDGPSFSVKEKDKLKDILLNYCGVKEYKDAPVVNFEYTNPVIPFKSLVRLMLKLDFIKEWILLTEQIFIRVSRIYSYGKDIATIVPCEGCAGNCSFCAINKAIGRIRSRPKEDILSEVKGLAAENVKDIRIMAADLGGYGMDTGSSLIQLLEGLVKIEGGFHLSLGEINPQWVVRHEEEFSRILSYGKISRLTIPVQSGSERILRLMRRPADIAGLKRALLAIKRDHPGIKMTSHMLIGFPGESEEDFRDSIDFFNEIGFYELWILDYVDKDIAESSNFPGKISRCEMKKRAREACDALSRNKEIRILYPTGLFFRGLLPRAKQYFYWKHAQK